MPTEGTIFINEFDVVKLSKGKLSSFRKKIGVVFQDLKLLADRTIFENVVLPLEVSGINPKEAVTKVENLLRQVGLLEHKDKFPIQLAGGEVQRVAIARALILSPEIILADEPTGNLDAATSWEIIKILSDINKNGTTIIMATHNTDIVKSMNKRVIRIEKGKVIGDEKVSVQEKKQVSEKEHHQKPKPEEKQVLAKEKDSGEDKE